jgi:hypothetical protein
MTAADGFPSSCFKSRVRYVFENVFNRIIAEWLSVDCLLLAAFVLWECFQAHMSGTPWASLNTYDCPRTGTHLKPQAKIVGHTHLLCTAMTMNVIAARDRVQLLWTPMYSCHKVNMELFVCRSVPHDAWIRRLSLSAATYPAAECAHNKRSCARSPTRISREDHGLE